MKAAHKWSLTGVLSIVGTLVAIWATGIWDHVGWTTPAAHAADIQTVKDERLLVRGEMKEFRDEWKCDEYDEELLDLRKQLAVVTTDAERVNIEHEIEKLKQKMEKLDCSRFEDFG